MLSERESTSFFFIFQSFFSFSPHQSLSPLSLMDVSILTERFSYSLTSSDVSGCAFVRVFILNVCEITRGSKAFALRSYHPYTHTHKQSHHSHALHYHMCVAQWSIWLAADSSMCVLILILNVNKN